MTEEEMVEARRLTVSGSCGFGAEDGARKSDKLHFVLGFRFHLFLFYIANAERS